MRSGMGLTYLQATGTGASIGTAIFPGIGTAIGAAIGATVKFAVDRIKGRNEKESYAEDIYPIVSPIVQAFGVPVACYHYEWLWILQPDGNIVSLSGEDTLPNDQAYEKCQEYADKSGAPVLYLQFMYHYLDGNQWFQIFKPSYALINPDFEEQGFTTTYEPVPTIKPVEGEESVVGSASLQDFESAQAGNILEAGFSGPLMLAAGLLIFSFINKGKK